MVERFCREASAKTVIVRRRRLPSDGLWRWCYSERRPEMLQPNLGISASSFWMLPMLATYILDQRFGIVARVSRKLEFDDHTIPQKQPNGGNRETSSRIDAGLTLVPHWADAAIGGFVKSVLQRVSPDRHRRWSYRVRRCLRRVAGSSCALAP
jgi:hypothetical protein